MKFNLQKHQIRKTLRQKRCCFSPKKQANRLINEKLYHFIQKQFHDITTIGLYYPIGDEVSLLSFAHIHAQDFCFYLPRIHHGKIKFIFWNQDDNLETDEVGILAPKNQKENIPKIICVPLVGFTKEKDRMGQGGGYYDRFISQVRNDINKEVIFIGIAFECQKVEILPIEEHDEKLDFIITEKQIY